MPNDPDDLADARARTRRRRRPVRRGRSLEASAAALTDHLRDNGYRVPPPAAPIPGINGAHSKQGGRGRRRGPASSTCPPSCSRATSPKPTLHGFEAVSAAWKVSKRTIFGNRAPPH